VLLDEDVPGGLSADLRRRGIPAVSVDELRSTRWPGQDRVSDSEVCAEVAVEPTVLVTLNVRDYADPAFVAANVAAAGIAVVIIRVSKSESRARARPQAIYDIVHRHVHRFPGLHDQTPVVVSATRAGFRRFRPPLP
jgi:hypothetical protein